MIFRNIKNYKYHKVEAMKKLYKAIYEGLHLIDFNNQKILKSVNNTDIEIEELENKIEEWIHNNTLMPLDLYNRLCKSKYIGLYKVPNRKILIDIIDNLGDVFHHNNEHLLNLNWIDISKLDLNNVREESIKWPNDPSPVAMMYKIDISDWDMLNIPTSFFYGNYDISSITIPDMVTKISPYAFGNCVNLEHTNLSNIVDIEQCAFNSCYKLNDINVLNVENFKNGCFAFCDELKKITFSKETKLIDHGSFAFCKKLLEVSYLGTKLQWDAINKKPNWHDGSPFTYVHCIDGDTINL